MNSYTNVNPRVGRWSIVGKILLKRSFWTSPKHFAQHHHQFKIAFFLHFLTMISSDKLLTDKIQDHLSLKHRSATHNAHWLNQELTTRKLCIFIVTIWIEIYSIHSHSISNTVAPHLRAVALMETQYPNYPQWFRHPCGSVAPSIYYW